MKSVIYEIKGNPSYSGSTDTNTRSFANGVYAHKMFVTYNERFFKGALEEVPFVFVDAMFSNGWLGYVDYEYFDTHTKSRVYYCNPSTLTYGNITIKPCVMYLVDSDWASRFHFENVLLHEMCHLYQVQVLCGCDLKTYDDELNTAVDHEHGDKFHESASLVNGSSFNTEWFLVTDNADDTYLVYRLDERNLRHGLKRGLFMNSRRHYEVTSRDIPNLSDRRSNARSRSSNIVARYQSFDKEKGEIRYNVTSQTKAGKSYTVSFRFKNWHPDMNHLDDEIQHSMKGDIEIDCTCPAFEFQGYKYLATLKGGSIEAERRPPDKTNRDRHGFACKHILKAIDSFNQDFDKFRSEGKGLIRKRNLRVQHKYESNLRNIRRRFEVRNLGKELYRGIASDINDFIERAQARFEEFCQNDFHCKVYDAYIDIEDGLQSDGGDWAINVLLCDDRSTLSERLYSFRPDGVYDDVDNFVGDTEDELLDNIAVTFADDYSDFLYDSMNGYRESRRPLRARTSRRKGQLPTA